MKKLLLITLMFLSSLVYSDNDKAESILIINSYSEAYNWTNDTMNGILDNLDSDIDVRVEYMDAKNYYSQADIDIFHSTMVHKYDPSRFDLIITTDDFAFSYVMAHREFYDNKPVFFTGLNSEDSYDFVGYKDVYGIIEKASVTETIQTAQLLMPSLRNIHVVVDASPTGQASKAEIIKALDSHYEVTFHDHRTLDEIEFYFREYNQENSIILLAFYIVDPRGLSFDTPVMTKRITEASQIPVFGLYDFSFNYGIIGGKLVSGYAQGDRLTKIIDDYYQGLFKGNHIESNEANIYKFDYQVIDRLSLNYKDLDKDMTVYNVPESFFSRNKDIILWGSGIIVVLIIYIIILRLQVNHQTKKNIVYNNKLNESDKLASLGEMMYRISHELNTPLGNSITTASFISKTNSELIENFNEGKLSKSMLIEKLSNIEYSSMLLETSLENANDLMSAFRVFSEHTSHDSESSFDITYYMKNLIKTYIPLLKAHNHKIVLTAKEQLIILGDSKNYYKIFSNLIQNSIEHGFRDLSDKEIHIDISAEKDHLYITYFDNGNGIQEKEINNIFKPLYTSRRSSHHGLGLSEVNDIVSKLQGSIKCHSRPNEGFTINMNIPVKKKYEK